MVESMAKKVHRTTKRDPFPQTMQPATSGAASAPEPTPLAPTTAAQGTPIPAARPPGRFSSIYLNEQDQRLLRELSVWFAGQGLRINDTLVLRIALRAARPGSALLAAYEDAVKSDRRFKKTR
jgi:hypothetical protein